MLWLLVTFSCSGTESTPAPTPAPAPVEAPAPAPEPAPEPVAAVPGCDSATLTPVARQSDAIAEPVRAKARVRRPVCKDGYAYALVGLGKGQEAAAAVFAEKDGAWKVHDLGDIDCGEPAPPLTSELCSELVKMWTEQKKDAQEPEEE